MGCFSAAAQATAFFSIAICFSPLARACEDCESRNAGLDVTSAVEELPRFRHRYEWQLTYRDDAAEDLPQLSQTENLPVANVTLDDSWVFGLRFELDYGWKR